MRSTLRLGLAVIAVAAGLLGCGTARQVGRPNPVPSPTEGEWAAVRNQATRRAILYDRFSHRATVTATYLGPQEREARVKQLAVWLGWTEQERARRLKAELDEAAKYDDFQVVFYTDDAHSNDLDAPSSIWRVALKLESGDVVTHDATTLDVNATLRNLFPYTTPFDVVYRVRFNRVASPPLEGRPYTLEFASAFGKLTLTFGDGTIGPDQPPGTPLP